MKSNITGLSQSAIITPDQGTDLKQGFTSKTNDWILVTATAIFSYLFYEQNAGINFLIFNILLISVLFLRNRSLLYNKKWWLSVTMCLLSSFGILVHSSALAVMANICGLLLLSAYSFTNRSSAIFSFFFSLYSVGTAIVHAFIDASTRMYKNQNKEKGSHRSYRVFTLFVVLILSVLFLSIYRESNPLFVENTKWINLDFISFPWVFFTAFSFCVVYGLFYHKTIMHAEMIEGNLSDENKQADQTRENQYTSEVFAGILLFMVLNFMLLIVNVGDINTIWLKGALPKGVSHSDFVHDGIQLIILSIIIATGLIMFLYRSNFQEIKNSKTLKAFVYIWILQNLVMLFSTACRNQIYIDNFNLTQMRIGVYVWLFLAVVGLIITYFKVRNNRSNWFLIKNNFNAWFCILALSSVINWDLLITKYNLNNKPLKDVDFDYLFSLGDSNIPELLEVTRNKDFHFIDDKKIYTNPSVEYYNTKSYKGLMMSKIKNYLTNYKNDWQSWDFTDKRIMGSIIK